MEEDERKSEIGTLEDLLPSKPGNAIKIIMRNNPYCHRIFGASQEEEEDFPKNSNIFSTLETLLQEEQEKAQIKKFEEMNNYSTDRQ